MDNVVHGPIDLEAFDLDEVLAAAEESRRRFAASKGFVSKLPAVEAGETAEDEVCSVCMEGFKEQQKWCDYGDGNKRVPCGHVFHASCITTWISHCNSCPLCRSYIFLQYT